MATTLAEILADLRTEAARSAPNDPESAADARTALSRLRPALDRLRDDGLDTGASINVDPDAFRRQADRAHWVGLLARTCDIIGNSAPPTADTPGRLTSLADAAAVAATLHLEVLTSGDRWQIVSALARTAHHLTAAAADGRETPATSRALIVAEASSSVLFQFASLDPPIIAEDDALHRPVPNPAARPTTVIEAALEASARLEHATRPGTDPLPIADILAIAAAAETTCRFVERAQLSVGDDRAASAAAGEAGDSARAWSNVRQALAPFNDGSRRPHATFPPAVQHALLLQRALQPQSSAPMPPDGFAPMPRVLDRLATVAARLEAAVVVSAASGQIMAYAVDLPMREARVGPFLAGRRRTGLVTADVEDLSPVQAALHQASARTQTLASTMDARPSTEQRSAQDDLRVDIRKRSSTLNDCPTEDPTTADWQPPAHSPSAGRRR